MDTGYKDKNNIEIKLGDKVKISCNPYHGIYEVKFGEYTLKPFSKKQIEVPHLGFYLSNGKNVISFLHVLKQPTDSFASTHSIEVIESKFEPNEIDIMDIINELVSNGISVRLEYKIQTRESSFIVDGFYKSGEVNLVKQDGKVIAHARYDEKTEIDSLRDIVELNYNWWLKSKERFEGWKNPDPKWIPLLEKFNFITRKTETVTTWEAH